VLPVEQPIVIDDVRSALNATTPFGQEVLRRSSAMVRDAVLLYAARTSWVCVSHTAFCEWAIQQMDPDYLWLVVDPLLPMTNLPAEAIRVRATRRPGAKDWVIDDEIQESIKARLGGREIGILDDAAASGDTLRFFANTVARANGQLTDVLVCASTSAARAVLRELVPGCSWAQLCAAPATPIHIRDACPLLPYSGRRLADRKVSVAGADLSMAAPPMYFRGSLWHQLSRDRAAWTMIREAWRVAAHDVSQSLNRPATVSDIPLIGLDVAIPLFARQNADQDSSLESLLA
jgi:hypothetical protein